MNKAQLVEKVALKAEWTKKDTAKLVELVLDEILDSLKNLEDVRLSGFGNFLVKKVNDRVAVNPMTKTEITVPACKKVAFHPSESMKAKLNK